MKSKVQIKKMSKGYWTITRSNKKDYLEYLHDMAVYLSLDRNQYIFMLKKFGAIWYGEELVFTKKEYAEKAKEWAQSIELMIQITPSKDEWADMFIGR